MTRKVHVTPGSLTVLQARIGLVIAALFLLFGIAMGAVVGQETSESESGMRLLLGLFLLIWVAACVAMLLSFARVLSRKGDPADRSLVDLHEEEPAAAGPSNRAGDFEARLRKLEALRRDGLVSEEEFQGKREEILREKW